MLPVFLMFIITSQLFDGNFLWHCAAYHTTLLWLPVVLIETIWSLWSYYVGFAYCLPDCIIWPIAALRGRYLPAFIGELMQNDPMLNSISDDSLVLWTTWLMAWACICLSLLRTHIWRGISGLARGIIVCLDDICWRRRRVDLVLRERCHVFVDAIGLWMTLSDQRGASIVLKTGITSTSMVLQCFLAGIAC